MRTKLFNFISQSFREKRLLFQGTPESAGGTEDADAQMSVPDDGQTDAGADAHGQREDGGDAPESNEQSSAEIYRLLGEARDKLEEIRENLGQVLDNQDEHTKAVLEAAGRLMAQVEDLEERLAMIEVSDPESAMDQLQDFRDNLDVLSVNKFTQEDLEADGRRLIDAREKATEAKAKTEEEKAKITLEDLRKKVVGQLGGGDEELKAAIAKIVFPDGFQEELDAKFQPLLDALTEAEGMNDPDAIEAKIGEETAKLAELTPEKFLEGLDLGQFKAVLDFLKTVLAFGSNDPESNAGKVKAEIKEAILADLEKGEFDAQKIKEEYSEKLAVAHVADVIEVTPEEFRSAARFYKLGRYKVLNESHPQYRRSQEILQKFMDAKNDGRLTGIAFDFFGNTNNVDHRLTTSESWHTEKAAALQKILKIRAAGNLNVSPDIESFIVTNEALIQQYIAGDNTTRIQLVKDNRDNFLKGGNIFDLALRLQRAANFKRFVENREEVPAGEAHTDVFTDEESVTLLHEDNNGHDALKAGIKVRLDLKAGEQPDEPQDEETVDDEAADEEDEPPGPELTPQQQDALKIEFMKARERKLAGTKGIEFVDQDTAKGKLGEAGSPYVHGGTAENPEIIPADGYEWVSKGQDYQEVKEGVIKAFKEQYPDSKLSDEDIWKTFGDNNFAVVQTAPSGEPAPDNDAAAEESARVAFKLAEKLGQIDAMTEKLTGLGFDVTKTPEDFGETVYVKYGDKRFEVTFESDGIYSYKMLNTPQNGTVKAKNVDADTMKAALDAQEHSDEIEAMKRDLEHVEGYNSTVEGPIANDPDGDPYDPHTYKVTISGATFENPDNGNISDPFDVSFIVTIDQTVGYKGAETIPGGNPIPSVGESAKELYDKAVAQGHIESQAE